MSVTSGNNIDVINWRKSPFELQLVRPDKVDLQFIVRAFPKMHTGGRSFFIISVGPVHVATETII